MTIQPHDTASLSENDTSWNQVRLLTGLLLGPVVYSLYFLAVYLLVEAACRENLLVFTRWGLDGLVVAVLGLTIAAIVLLLIGMLVSYGNQSAKLSEEAQANQHLIRQMGLWLSGFFVVVTLVTGVPILFLELCSWV